MNRRRWAGLALELWLPVVIVVVWWFASASSTSLYFPPLSAILTSFAADWLTPSGVVDNLLPSLRVLGLGYLIAVVAGVAIGTLLGRVRALETATRPLLEILRAIPGVSLLPIFIVLFGIGMPMKVLLIAFGSFWPVLLNTVDGIRGSNRCCWTSRRASGSGACVGSCRSCCPARVRRSSRGPGPRCRSR